MAFNVRLIAFVATIGMLLLVAGCGGGGGDGGSSLPTGPNVQAVSVSPNPAPYNNVNTLFTTVRICAPGTSNCQTIDRVLVDTGSVGLRIMSSALSPTLNLPQSTDTTTGNALVECGTFAASVTWGPVKVADIGIANELAPSMPIQVIGDSAFPTPPTSCSNMGPVVNTPQLLNANGLLGIGVFREDCGQFCVGSPAGFGYFECVGSTCSDVGAPLVQQVQNPVASFAVNNNGTVISLPAINGDGTSSATGVLIFGIGTQPNNGLGGARIQQVDPNLGTFSTVFNGVTFLDAFIDSGSNALFFDEAFANYPIPNCGDFFCPGSVRSLSATTQTSAGTTVINFQIGSQNGSFVQPHLAGSSPGVFDWGLPFFYGRSVYTAIEGQSTPAGTGPFFAY